MADEDVTYADLKEVIQSLETFLREEIARRARWDQFEQALTKIVESVDYKVEPMGNTTSDKTSHVEDDRIVLCQPLDTAIQQTLDVVKTKGDLYDESESQDVSSFTEENQTLAKPQPGLMVKLADASSMMTQIDEKMFLREGVVLTPRGKEIVAVVTVWVSHGWLNPHLRSKSFHWRSSKWILESSTLRKSWIFEIPTKLPPPEPPDRVAIPTSPLEQRILKLLLRPPEPSDSSCCIVELNLRPLAKPSDRDRCSENKETKVVWFQSLHMAIPSNTGKRDTGHGHQLDPFPKQMGQTQPNTAMRWASKKCAMQWVETTKIQELIVEVFSSFVSPTISIRTSRFRNFLKIYAEEDTGYKTFGYKFEIGLKEIMHSLGIIMLCISAVVLLLHAFFHGFPILQLEWGIIGAAIPLNTSWWMIIFAQLLYITITKSKDTWSEFIWLAMVDLSGLVKPYLTSIIILCLQFSLGGFKLGLSCTGVLNSVSNYIKLMKSIFNFQIDGELLSAPKIPFCYVSCHEATGAYVNHVPVDELVAPKSSLLNCKPINFGGGRLDPNLTYAKELIACMGLGNSLTICVEIESYDYMSTLFKHDYDTYERKWVRHQNTWRFCHGQCIIAVTNILNHDIPLFQQLQHNQGCQSKLSVIAGSKKPTSIIKGALYIWSACSSALVQDYYVNTLLNNVFTPEQFYAYVVNAVSSVVRDLNRWEARKVGMTSLLLLGCLLAVRTFFGFHEIGFWLALSIGKIERLQFAHMVLIVQIMQLDGTSLGCALPDMELLIEPDSFAALVKGHGSSTDNTFCKIWQD